MGCRGPVAVESMFKFLLASLRDASRPRSVCAFFVPAREPLEHLSRCSHFYSKHHFSKRKDFQNLLKSTTDHNNVSII